MINACNALSVERTCDAFEEACISLNSDPKSSPREFQPRPFRLWNRRVANLNHASSMSSEYSCAQIPSVFEHLQKVFEGGVGHFAHSPPFLVTGLALVVVVLSLLPFVSLHLDRDSHLIIHPRLRGSRSHGTEK